MIILPTVQILVVLGCAKRIYEWALFLAEVIEPGLFIIRPGHGPYICLTRQVWVAHRWRHGDMLDFEALEQADLTEYDLE